MFLMAAPRTRRQSKRFVPARQPEQSAKRRLVLPEGDWQSIRSDLEVQLVRWVNCSAIATEAEKNSYVCR